MALCEFVLRTTHSCALFFFFRNNPVLKQHQQSMLHNNLSNPEGFSAVQYCRVFKFLKARIFLYEELIATYVVARWLFPLYESSFGLIRVSFLVKRWMLIESYYSGQCMISSARMFLRMFRKMSLRDPFIPLVSGHKSIHTHCSLLQFLYLLIIDDQKIRKLTLTKECSL